VISEIIRDLVCYYQTKIDADEMTLAEACNVIQEKLDDFLPEMTSDQLIQSTEEGNTFRWSEMGFRVYDWFSIWTKVKKILENSASGLPSKGRGVFGMNFNNIQH